MWIKLGFVVLTYSPVAREYGKGRHYDSGNVCTSLIPPASATSLQQSVGIMLWFTQVVFRWRTACSCVWVTAVNIATLLIFKLVGILLSWNQFSIFPSLKEGFLLTTYLLLLIVVMIIYSATYSVRLPVFKTRLAAIWNILQPQRVVTIAIFAVMGGACSFCLSDLVGYAGFTQPCKNLREKYCLNEYTMFCVTYGAAFGCCYGLQYYMNKGYFMVFPSIQQRLSFRVRGHFYSHVWEGFLASFKVLRFHYPVYYIGGMWLKLYVMNLLDSALEDPSLTTIYGLLDPFLLVRMLLMGMLMHFSWSFGLRLFQTFQTQTVVFPVVATFSGDSSKLLQDALKSKIDLLKALGFLDLYQTSLHSPHRRKQVFSLTQTGQPKVWEEVCGECLKHVRTFTAGLASGKVEANPSASSLSSPTHLSGQGLYQLQDPNQNSYTGSDSRGKGWSSPQMYDHTSTLGATRRYFSNQRAILWSYSPGNSVEGVSNYSHSTSQGASPSIIYSALAKFQDYISSIPASIAVKLKKKPFFIYFLSELPDMAYQDTCADCQLIVWSITSISELAIASYSEDIYGVVQRSLSEIINSLVELSQTLDKHLKAPLSNSRSTSNTRIALEANGRYAIKTAVQTALYRLATTFSNQRRSIPLSAANSTYWNKYFSSL